MPSPADRSPLTATLEQVGGPVVPNVAWLAVLSGPDQGKTLRLDPGTHTVGQASDCSLVLVDGAVSRSHLEIQVSEGVIRVRDLGSKNGSFFQGARFENVSVGVGAVLTIGSTELRVITAQPTGKLSPSAAERFGGLLGRSLAMREAFAVLERVSQSNATVLIEAETGTGKEICARAIHDASPRAKGPFAICDLSSVSRSLIESELFGHKKGAFTGADRDRTGQLVRAHHGTLFIDEVGELELEGQPRLLRALESGQVRAVGAEEPQTIDARVVVATNRDLEAECKAGRFREDLYHRLAVIRVRLPPLRERKEDIPLLVQHFLKGRAVQVPVETLALLTDYDWPGNVRQLRNVVERALSLIGDQKELTPELLGLPALGIRGSGQGRDEAFHEAKERMIADWERVYLGDLLRKTRGNVARAARESGLGRPHLYRLMKKHGIDPREG